MPSSIRAIVLVMLLLAAGTSQSQNKAATANTNPVYQQLRNLGLGEEAVSVNNLTIVRDAATFTLRSGTVCFMAPVEGKVTGAVFIGDGGMGLQPPLAVENDVLRLLTKSDEFNETFTQAAFRFTDSTYDEIRKAGSPAAGSCDPSPLKDSQNTMRHNRVAKYNLDGRILQDVLGSEPGGLFVAFIHGKHYNDKEIFALDPHGAPPIVLPIAPEEVEFVTYDENKMGVWAAFHRSNEYAAGKASGAENNGVVRIDRQELDTTIERNANLTGKAITTLAANVDGLRVVPLDLYPKLRVNSVVAEDGSPLEFIQEDKDDDADFFVLLPRALTAGEKFTITTSYSGKEAVTNEGNGNYFPVARDDWYPNVTGGLGSYSSYEMTFRIPKGMTMVATGTPVSAKDVGSQNISVWKSEVPQTVAGFNFGTFKMEEAKMQSPDYLVQAFANKEPPDSVKRLLIMANPDLPGSDAGLGVPLGNMSTVPMLKKALAESQVSMQLYTDYFGPAPFKRLAVTQQTSCSFGQAWPALVWLPICSFFDGTVRHTLGLDFGDRGYWKIVTPHEVAHQWWGHLVGFQSYRDQWMSEGFAEMSASLFIQLIEKDPKKFIDFWNDERDALLEKNVQGFRAIDAGPVTLGYRLSNSRSGFSVTRNLIYPKGAYILHMLRMMLTQRGNDQAFKDLMRDFVSTYAGRAATTEDFKAIVEKHMTREMIDMAGGTNSMDWFFNEYVYGTALPSYDFSYSFSSAPDGTILLNFKLAQTGVDDNFRMLVPIYLELADGRVAMAGRLRIKGKTDASEQIPLVGLKEKPKRAMINYMNDVLASPN